VLHESSVRAKGPFVALNCAALPEHLIEDMLFGHEKGAFTGATKEHKGLFEQASGGTIFLDEIGEMPMQLQAKLLRVLQERKINRLGGEALIDVDVRVIAATNKDLKLAIEQREFREDLYFRISTFRLRLQPLKDRPGDIMPLVVQSLARHATAGVPFTVTPEAQAMLQAYSWPGNVRELENVVQRAVVLCGGRVITPAHLMFDETATEQISAAAVPAGMVYAMSDAAQAATHAPAQPMAMPTMPVSVPVNSAPVAYDMSAAANLEDAVKNSELQVIMAAIQTTASRMEAAAKLGISPRTLRYKLAQFRQRGLAEGVSA
jgi:two-component system response regulator FlrC